MDRWSTGEQTYQGSHRIELSWLIKQKFLEKGYVKQGTLSWSSRGEPSGNIGIICSYTEEKFIRLFYSITDYADDQKYDYDYKIYLTSIPSNLGKGEVLYFLCPVSGKRCRILYRAYGYHQWKSREAYQNKLYYDSQISSKIGYAHDRYWALDRKIEKMEGEKNFHSQHKGQPTRKAEYLQKLRNQRDEWDWKRWEPEYLPKSMRGMFNGLD